MATLSPGAHVAGGLELSPYGGDVTVVSTVIFVVGDQTTVPVAPAVPLISAFVVSQLFKLPEKAVSHSTAFTVSFMGKPLPVTVIVLPFPFATVAGAIVTVGVAIPMDPESRRDLGICRVDGSHGTGTTGEARAVGAVGVGPVDQHGDTGRRTMPCRSLRPRYLHCR